MINFPILKNLHVSGYGLYPGREGDDGLVVEFAPGLTLVLGTNGLGKSTLVSILFRLLAGPFDIPGLKERTQLGNVELEATLVRPRVRSMFAQRVADNAVDAKARLVFDIGSTSLVVERRLRDLSLLRFSIDGIDTPSPDEQTFSDKIVELVGLWSFGDWILLLRHLTFTSKIAALLFGIRRRNGSSSGSFSCRHPSPSSGPSRSVPFLSWTVDRATCSPR